MEEGETTSTAAPPPDTGPERRREVRYAVQWDAEIFIPDRTAMFRGQVVNISTSGCYVRTVAWVRVPPSTEVELVFLLDGRMVRARAEARFAQSRTGVGLRFLPLEVDVRRRLDLVLEMLSTATAPAVEAEAGAG
jgi:PilZ domain